MRAIVTEALILSAAFAWDFFQTSLWRGELYHFDFYVCGVHNFLKDIVTWSNWLDGYTVGHFCWGVALGRLCHNYRTVLVWHTFWEIMENAGGGPSGETLVNAAGDTLAVLCGCSFALCYLSSRRTLLIVGTSELMNQSWSFAWMMWRNKNKNTTTFDFTHTMVGCCVVITAMLAMAHTLSSVHCSSGLVLYTATTVTLTCIGYSVCLFLNGAA